MLEQSLEVTCFFIEPDRYRSQVVGGTNYEPVDPPIKQHIEYSNKLAFMTWFLGGIGEHNTDPKYPKLGPML